MLSALMLLSAAGSSAFMVAAPALRSAVPVASSPKMLVEAGQ